MNSAIREGFRERGWRAQRGRPGAFQAPESLMAAPLALRVWAVVDADKYGGASLTGQALVQCDEVTDVVVGFDRESLPSSLTVFPGDELIRDAMNLGVATAGGLLDPLGNYYRWLVTDLDEVRLKTAEFFAMVDGPLADWAQARDKPAKLFAEVADLETPTQLRASGTAIRAVSVLALLHGRVDVARAAVAVYVPDSPEDEQRFPLFEQQLATHFAEYGPLQRG